MSGRCSLAPASSGREAAVAPGKDAPDPTIASNRRPGRVVVAAADEDEVAANLLDAVAWFRDRVLVTTKTGASA
jgi:hypothetical protein